MKKKKVQIFSFLFFVAISCSTATSKTSLGCFGAHTRAQRRHDDDDDDDNSGGGGNSAHTAQSKTHSNRKWP